MNRTLFGFIWRYSKRQQIIILMMTIVSFPILYMTLELPKWIVNDAISGTDFPKIFLGFELEQIPYLVSLCVVFLGLVVLNNVVKYLLNMTKGVAGERMLRRLRFMLYDSVLRFRLSRFRKVSGGEIIPMITAEVEDVGVFIGEAIATPAFQGGTLLVYIVFIFAQDPFLGAAAVSLYPFQAYIIPKLQRRVILLSRERIKNIRTVSDRINETVSAAADIQANDTSRYHLADLSDRLFVNYRIRLAIFKRKFMIKFINNFLNQLPPFFFYSVGGYLVIEGELTFGALVAVLAAYKDLASPWKELLNWYQNLANVSVKYQTVVENFDVDETVSPRKVGSVDDDVPALPNRDLELSGVSASASGSALDVNDVSLSVSQGKRLAVFGRDGSGRSELLYVLCGILDPSTGKATLGGQRLDEMTFSTVAHYVSYVGSDPYIFNDTIRNNVIYGLKTRPHGDATDDYASQRRSEAMLTGNSILDITARWEDYGQAGVEAADALDEKLLDLIALVGLDNDLFRLGLSSHHIPEKDDVFADGMLSARREVIKRVHEDAAWADLVELWQADTFNASATIGENTLFGLPADPNKKVWECAADAPVGAALKEAGLFDTLIDMGAETATMMIELFANTGADASLMGDYSFLAPDEVPEFERRLRTHKSHGKHKLNAADAAAFVNLAFRIVPGRHRIVTIDTALEEQIIAAREIVHKHLDGDKHYSLFEGDRFVPALSVEENILFGKPRVDRRGARDRIDAFLRETVTELGLRKQVERAGLSFGVGVAGGRLSASQRRRLGLVRALVKRPQILVFDAVADGDPALLDRLMGRAVSDEDTVIIGTADPEVARRAPTVAVMNEGHLVAQGPWDSVNPNQPERGTAAPKEKEPS